MKLNQKLAFLIEIFFNGSFIILYSLTWLNKVTFEIYARFIEQFLTYSTYIVPFVVLFSILVNFIESHSWDEFFRKYVFSIVVIVPMLITFDREFVFWLASAHLLSSVLSLYELGNDQLIKDNSKKNGFKFSLTPAQWVLVSFSGVILIGALILILPMSSQTGKSISFVDALFMSASATCVTGLATKSIATDFSTLGQIVILVLIQIGGLSIMTLYASMTVLLGQSLGMKNRLLMLDLLNVSSLEELFEMIIDIVRYTFFIELWGGVILTIGFNLSGLEFGKSLYYGFYHSISAFCNAGFSLFNDSLEQYATNPIINFTIMALIIMGGIGFIVIKELNFMLKTKFSWHRLSFHSKIVIITSGVLITGGALFIFFVEFLHGIDQYTLWEKIQISLFQSVTLRTAGFNSISLNSLFPFTVYVMTLFMFIGGSPGSTAGGIKTTTLAILVQTIITTVKGESNVKMLNRRIPQELVIRTIALTFISILFACTLIPVLMAVEPNQEFLPLLFESISALGTVGLSLGITPYLTVGGKLVITLLMFLGRIGPLTLVLAIGEQKDQMGKIDYPNGRIMIG